MVFQFLTGSKLDPLPFLYFDLFFPADIPAKSCFFGNHLEAGESSDLDLLFSGQGFLQRIQDGLHQLKGPGPAELGIFLDVEGDVVLDHR